MTQLRSKNYVRLLCISNVNKIATVRTELSSDVKEIIISLYFSGLRQSGKEIINTPFYNNICG